MDADIEKWKNKQKHSNYCNACGGSGQQHVNVTGNPKIDFSTCQYCKGTGQPIKLKASKKQRKLKPWINEFERIFNNEKDIQQPKEVGGTEPFKLTTLSGSVSKSRQREADSQRNNKKSKHCGYALPGTGGQNHPIFLHQGEIRQLHETKNTVTL